MKLGLAAHVAQAAVAFLDRFEAQQIPVEGPRAVEILRGQLRDSAGCPQRGVHGVSSNRECGHPERRAASREVIDTSLMILRLQAMNHAIATYWQVAAAQT